MADRITKEQRSKNMAAVKHKDTKPEIQVRSYLHRHGFRFRLHDSNLPGKPDIILKKYQSVIFIHGCFWHGHTCKKGKLPATNTEFWEEKISKNITRDKKTSQLLENNGWKVITIWECEINDEFLDKLCARFQPYYCDSKKKS